MIRVARVLREMLLTAAAICGAACIVLVVLSITGGYSLVMFKTGSMSPTIPAGSVALVQLVSADALQVGDIATVDRPGNLPVTHRITHINAGDTAQERELTMRGDANEVEDPDPYTVTEARVVRGSVAGLAPAIASLGNPWVLGCLTIAASSLVTWAFWPRRAKPSGERSEEPDHKRPGSGANGGTARPATARGAAGLAALAIVLVPVLSSSDPAVADSTSPRLFIRSSFEPGSTQYLDAERPRFWFVEVDANTIPADNSLSIDMASEGESDFRMKAEVRSCASSWDAAGVCERDERLLRESSVVPADGRWNEMWSDATPDAVYLQIALLADPLTVEAGDQGASLVIRARADGAFAQVGIDGQPPMAVTGAGRLAWVAAPAAVLFGLGVAAMAHARRAGSWSRS